MTAAALALLGAGLTIPIGGAANAGGAGAFQLAQYMQSAAPPVAGGTQTPKAVGQCKRVCVKAGKGSYRAPPPCLQWKTVC